MNATQSNAGEAGTSSISTATPQTILQAADMLSEAGNFCQAGWLLAGSVDNRADADAMQVVLGAVLDRISVLKDWFDRERGVK